MYSRSSRAYADLHPHCEESKEKWNEMSLNKSIACVAGVVLMVSVGGCVMAPVVPPTGLLYTDMKAPINIGPSEQPSKRGESSVVAILGLFSTGDGSVRAAADAGQISNVEHIDYEYKNVLGIYQRYTTIVYGE